MAACSFILKLKSFVILFNFFAFTDRVASDFLRTPRS